MLPNVISGLIEAKVSLTRVQKFLFSEELGMSLVCWCLLLLTSLFFVVQTPQQLSTNASQVLALKYKMESLSGLLMVLPLFKISYYSFPKII